MELIKKLLDKSSEMRSQRELAALMGVSEQKISNWKSGARPMSEHQFAKLAELVEGERKAKTLLWDFVHLKQQVSDKISAGFEFLLSLGKPRGALFYAV